MPFVNFLRFQKYNASITPAMFDNVVIAMYVISGHVVKVASY